MSFATSMISPSFKYSLSISIISGSLTLANSFTLLVKGTTITAVNAKQANDIVAKRFETN